MAVDRECDQRLFKYPSQIPHIAVLMLEIPHQGTRSRAQGHRGIGIQPVVIANRLHARAWLEQGRGIIGVTNAEIVQVMFLMVPRPAPSTVFAYSMISAITLVLQ